MSKCDVCGHDGETFVACSACGGTTFQYCHDCLAAGAEPWGELADYIAICGNYPEDINDAFCEIVRNTCERLGKTEEDFIKTVDNILNEGKEVPSYVIGKMYNPNNKNVPVEVPPGYVYFKDIAAQRRLDELEAKVEAIEQYLQNISEDIMYLKTEYADYNK